MLGELEVEFFTARAVRDLVVAELEAMPTDPQAALARALLCKEVVTNHAAAVVEKALQIAGGRSYLRRSPLEHLSRDVRAARFHPQPRRCRFR